MEPRQLIKFGKSSFVVSLPHSWIKKFNLKKGDTIFVTETEHNLSLSPQKVVENKQRKKIIKSDGKSLGRLETEIVSAYLNNYDIIEVTSKSELKYLKGIKDIFQNLAGLEILEQTSTHILAKDLISVNDLDVNALTKRIDFIVRSMLSETRDSISLGADISESMFQRDLNVNRLVFLTYRFLRHAAIDPNLRTQTGMETLGLQKYYLVVMRLEKIADFVKRATRHLSSLKLSKSEKDELYSFFDEALNRYSEVITAFYEHDKEKALELELSNQGRNKRYDAFLDKSGNRNLTRVIENLKNMFASFRNIARSTMSGEDKPV